MRVFFICILKKYMVCVQLYGNWASWGRYNLYFEARGGGGGGAEALRRHLNFRKVSHRFTSSFTNPCFQDLNGSHIMYWTMMILNPSRFKVEPPLEILIFLHWTCRLTFTTLLGKRRAISHLMAVPKNREKCKSATISLHRGDSLSASGPPVEAFKGLLLKNAPYFVF